MAEEIRSVKEVLEELFKRKKNKDGSIEYSALEKLALAKLTRDEILLYLESDMPKSEINKNARLFFQKSFLKKSIYQATEAEIRDAYNNHLLYAVGDSGCRGRCRRLVEELNAALAKNCIEQIEESKIDAFIDWLTYDYHSLIDESTGWPKLEYGFTVRIHHDVENRKDFWKELQLLLKEGKMLPMHSVLQIVYKRREAKTIKH